MARVGFYARREFRHCAHANHGYGYGADWVIYALMAVATATSAVAAVQQGQAQADAADAQSKAAEYNAQVSRQNARNAILQASAQEDQIRRENAYKLGELRGSLLEAGIGSSGTAESVLNSSVRNTELDALNVRYGGQLKANSLLTGANLDSFSADVYRNQASQAQTAGYLGCQLFVERRIQDIRV